MTRATPRPAAGCETRQTALPKAADGTPEDGLSQGRKPPPEKHKNRLTAMTQRTIKKGNTKTVMAEGYEALAGFALSVPALFDGGRGETLHSGRNTVKAFDADGRRLVAKRYKRPNMVQRIAYTFFRKSKAERAFIYARALRKLGFDTPHEAAYIEIRRNGLLSDSYFISEECSLPPLMPLLDRDNPDQQAAEDLASLLADMHVKGALHGDLNLSNILYAKDGGGRYKFTLIDTNRSKFKQPTADECLDNLKRLTHNRALMTLVVTLYARKRGWDAGKTVEGVMRKLDKFERKCEARQHAKKVLRKRHGA